MGYLGDTLLVEAMCRNIKQNILNSNILFFVNEPFKEIPLGFESVDKIYSYDKKKKHKGITGYIKFLKAINEKNIDYAIITHPHERSILLAKIIGAKKIISLPIKRSFFNVFVNQKRKYYEEESETIYRADYNNKYLNGICEYKNIPICYKRLDINEKEILDKFKLYNPYIVLSPTSKDLIKDWDYDNIKNFILKSERDVVLVGTNKAKEIAEQLKAESIKFIDLSLRTTITELAAVIKNSQYCVSVDTGTFHLSYAQNVNTIGLFFSKEKLKKWSPSNLKNITILLGERCGDKRNFVSKKDIKAEEVLQKIKI